MIKKDYIWFINKKIKRSSNIIFCIFISLCILIVLTSYSIIYNIKAQINETIEKNTGFRLLTIEKYDKNGIIDIDINEFLNINHVVNIFAKNYTTSTIFPTKEFKSDIFDGKIMLKPLLEDGEIKIKNGVFFKNNENEAICSDNFYPHSYNDSYNLLKVIDGKKIIGKKISSVINDQTFEFEIIGTFDSNFSKSSQNTCYISYKDFSNIIEIKTGVAWPLDTILIDTVENAELIKKSLEKDNYVISSLSYVDYEEINSILIPAYFILVISTIITLILILCFTIKHEIYKKKENSLLKILGFNKKTITKINYLEYIILFTLITLVSLTLFLICLALVKYIIFAKLSFYSFNFKIPIAFISVVYFTIFTLILFIIKVLYQKRSK